MVDNHHISLLIHSKPPSASLRYAVAFLLSSWLSFNYLRDLSQDFVFLLPYLHGVFSVGTKCEYRIFSKCAPGINYFQMASHQALNSTRRSFEIQKNSVINCKQCAWYQALI